MPIPEAEIHYPCIRRDKFVGLPPLDFFGDWLSDGAIDGNIKMME